MMQEYHLRLQQHLDAAVRDAQHWAHMAHMAEATYAAETDKATTGTAPVSREEHTRSQPRAHIAHCRATTLTKLSL
jgi:hypothetical protein